MIRHIDLTKDELANEEVEMINKLVKKTGVSFHELAISYLEFKKLGELFNGNVNESED